MPEHIPAFDNKNEPIVGANHPGVPLVYFNRLVLRAGESFSYQLTEYESCVVPLSGRCEVRIDPEFVAQIGSRDNLWQGLPNGVYVPVGGQCQIRALDAMEIFVAGGRYEQYHPPFVIGDEQVDVVQYGSDETKTHRKIKHILGQSNAGQRGRLLVSELFTVGEGGWSGFPPHKHDTENPPEETRFEEVYQFRFLPEQGFAAQFGYQKTEDHGPVFHVKHGSTFLIDKGYHPCVVAPGYQMYYFTIIVGEKSQSLRQYFEPAHAAQIETIPGIKDMISKFK